MARKKVSHLQLSDQTRMALTIERLSMRLIEDYDGAEELCIIGIQPRGTALAHRLVDVLKEMNPPFTILFGLLDVTFYRDDFRRRDKPLEASSTEMDFIVENRPVVLVDDVLYTGRTVSAALSALADYGRATSVRLLSLVERRFNREVPIKSDFTGFKVDAVDGSYVKVNWKENDGQDEILLIEDKNKL